MPEKPMTGIEFVDERTRKDLLGEISRLVAEVRRLQERDTILVRDMEERAASLRLAAKRADEFRAEVERLKENLEVCRKGRALVAESHRRLEKERDDA